MHWTPEARKKISERQAAFYKTPAGKRAIRKRIKARERKRAANVAASNGHEPDEPATRAASGRAMLVALARAGALVRVIELQRELEKLTLFLNRTKP